MKHFRTLLAAVAAGATVLAGCESSTLEGTTGGVQNRDILGGALGAAGGYLACKALDGNNTTCALAAVGGAAAGVVIARRLKPEDEAPRAVALAEVVEGDATSRTWKSAETGSSGEFTLVSQSQTADGQPCRTVSETYSIRGDAPLTEEFKLCQATSGEWETVG